MWALLFFVVGPLVELYVWFLVAKSVGFLTSLLLLGLSFLIGVALVKRAGLGVLRRMQQAIESQGRPEVEAVDGFLVLVAGLLFVLPGFVTDAAGLLLLVPPIRRAVGSVVLRRFAAGVGADGMTMRFTARFGGARSPGGFGPIDTTGAEAPPASRPSLPRPEDES